MDIHLLAGTMLFQGIREHEIEAMLTCFSAEERTYGKDAYIYRAGDVTGIGTLQNPVHGREPHPNHLFIQL